MNIVISKFRPLTNFDNTPVADIFIDGKGAGSILTHKEFGRVYEYSVEVHGPKREIDSFNSATFATKDHPTARAALAAAKEWALATARSHPLWGGNTPNALWKQRTPKVHDTANWPDLLGGPEDRYKPIEVTLTFGPDFRLVGANGKPITAVEGATLTIALTKRCPQCDGFGRTVDAGMHKASLRFGDLEEKSRRTPDDMTEDERAELAQFISAYRTVRSLQDGICYCDDCEGNGSESTEIGRALRQLLSR